MIDNHDIAEQLYKKLLALQPISPEQQAKLDKKFRLEFNYNSNHLEGNTLTYGETELLLIFGDTMGNHNIREYEEMKAHDVGYQLIADWAKDTEWPLTEQHIKNLNEIILVQPYWKEAITQDGQNTRRQIKVGNYKELPNSVRLQNGEIFHYASPSETPIFMQELIDWYRGEEGSLAPITLAAMLHYKFVSIHPFDDGNGRISRLLMNYVLLKSGYPPVIIKSEDKANYLRALHIADTGDFEPFISYIASQVIWSLNISIRAARGESIDEPGDLDKKLVILKNKLGQKDVKQLQLKYSLKAVVSIVNSLRPLVDEWQEKLKEFDTLFYSRSNMVWIGSTPSSGSDLYNVFDSLSVARFGKDVQTIEEQLNGTEQTEIKQIKIQTEFKQLRTSDTITSFNGGEIEVTFHEHLYEISYTGTPAKLKKLYHELPDRKERQLIIETMGNWLLNNIEQALG